MGRTTAQAPDLFPPGTVVGGQYRVLERLGAGAMGAVYKVEDQRLRRLAALKAINVQLLNDARERKMYLERFKMEATAAANTVHDAIITIYNAGEHGGFPYYVMEFIPNALTLSAVITQGLERGAFVPVDDVRAYFLQAAAGTQRIHVTGAIHRDLKPDNLLTFRAASGPRLKILDFGVVRLPDSDLTRSSIVGTPTYFAPEYVDALLFGAKVKIDHRVDIFALGVSLYYTLTGQKPFRGADYTDLYRALRELDPPAPSTLRRELDPHWDAVVARCLAKDRDHRYQDAGEVYESILHLEDVQPFVPPSHRATSAGGQPPPDPLADDMPEIGPHAGGPDFSGSTDVVKHTQSDEVSAPPLQGAAAEFARGLASPPPTSKLPARIKLALAGVAGVVALLVLAVVFSGGHSDRGVNAATTTALVDASAAQVKPKAVSPEQLLREEQEARRRQQLLVARTDAPIADLAAPRPEPRASSSTGPAVHEARPAPVAAGPRARSERPASATPTSTLAGSRGAAATPPADGRRRRTTTGIIAYFEQPPSPAAAPPAGASARLGIGTGTRVGARLESPLSSESPSTPAIAILHEPVLGPDGSQLVPAGARAVGHASFRIVSDSVARVEISFTRLVLPDGTEKGIRAIAAMPDGSAGIPARVTTKDGRAISNLAEAALDTIGGVLSGEPGGSAADRFIEDQRSDARSKRRQQVTLSTPKNAPVTLLFTDPA